MKIYKFLWEATKTLNMFIIGAIILWIMLSPVYMMGKMHGKEECMDARIAK